ncbi:MAG: hypothetical protein WKF43_06190 [Acidimicrobiales bacterium]
MTDAHAVAIDVNRLGRWMDSEGLPGAGQPVEARFVSGGASNEIYEIRRGEHRMALRRPPRLVPEGRNQIMRREHRLLAAWRAPTSPTRGRWPCATTARSSAPASTSWSSSRGGHRSV